ncbi:MAG: hypothetical protein LUE99_12900, partial [Bacteroides sp.]|nr:hypothetical protein [Bacteroides sp.]
LRERSRRIYSLGIKLRDTAGKRSFDCAQDDRYYRLLKVRIHPLSPRIRILTQNPYRNEVNDNLAGYN